MDKTLTVQRESYRLSIRALSAVASVGEKIGLPFGQLEETSMLAAARSATGLQDMGGDHFVAPMRQLIANLEKRELTALGKVSTRAIALKHLTNRLCLTEHFRQHPTLKDLPIERPVFILGFPRTGTTLAQDLLAKAPGSRALQFWELATPVPVSEDEGRDRHLRTKDAQQKLDVTYRVAPELMQVHETRTDTLEECWPLLANSFSAANWEMSMGCTDYGGWLLEQDLVPAYQDYKRSLQVLASNSPGRRLVLKCPDHLATLDALLEVFPDACLVWTHRDPVDCIASYCSMVSIGWRVVFGKYHPLEIGPVVHDGFLRWVTRAMAVRDRVGEDRFFDVNFEDFTASPAATIEAMAEHCGMPGRSASEVAADMARGRSDEKGKHVYSVPRYGIDPDAVHRSFAEYIERFSVTTRNSEAYT